LSDPNKHLIFSGDFKKIYSNIKYHENSYIERKLFFIRTDSNDEAESVAHKISVNMLKKTTSDIASNSE